jgi:chromate transporter
MLIWELFWTFLKIGFISFGGGFAMIPVIQHETNSHQWMTDAQYAEGVALAGMAPGPIATNSAIFVGYHTAGIMGSIFAAVGIILPSIISIVLLSFVFYKLAGNKDFKSALYGLRPIIAALIMFAAFRLAVVNPHLRGWSWSTLVAALFFIAAFTAMYRFKMHPFAMILLSGLIGIAVYG